MKNKLFTLLVIFVIAFTATSCLKDKEELAVFHYFPEDYQTLQAALNLPQKPHDYGVNLPAHLGGGFEQVRPELQNDKAILGRVLFYDKNLSVNNKVSCASCHEQRKAFADGRQFSPGFDGTLTKRNSLALAATVNFETAYGGGNSFNAFSVVNAGFFWDERATSVHEQTRLTLEDPIEMGTDLEELPNKIADIPHYQILFKKAFPGNGKITSERILESIDVFVNSIASFNSKFDKGLATRNGFPFEDFVNFTPAENFGKMLYLENCASCHGDRLITNPVTVANNGLDEVYADQGMGAISRSEQQMGVFKVPLLRNVALTAPYMHDGRFATLEEVVDHYSEGIQDHPNLDHQLRDLNSNKPRRMNFTGEQKSALVAFLRTLSDDVVTTEEKYGDPFK